MWGNLYTAVKLQPRGSCRTHKTMAVARSPGAQICSVGWEIQACLTPSAFSSQVNACAPRFALVGIRHSEMLWDYAELSSPAGFQQVRPEAAYPQRLPRQFWCLVCSFPVWNLHRTGRGYRAGTRHLACPWWPYDLSSASVVSDNIN